jgi:hypothetical protein
VWQARIENRGVTVESSNGEDERVLGELPAQDETSEERELRAQLVEVGQSLGKLGRTAARRSSARRKAVVDASKQKVDGGYRTVTLKEYRDEVDRALADITHVLVVLEARVSALESEEPPNA